MAAGSATNADVKLRPTRNLPKQLSNAEWFVSFPGTDSQKKALLNCISCHNLDRIVNSAYSAEEFMQVFDRMTGYYPGSTPQHPQRLIGDARRNLGQGPGVKAMAEYLASINLSKDESWSYELKTLPRPTGRATRVVITEYDLPRKQVQPHDVVVDSDGIIWFSHFGEQFLGKMDPKTGKVWEFPIPVLKAGFPVGTLDLKTDRAGNLWVGMMYQAGVARFDKKTETFKVWSIPKEWQTDAAQSGHLDPSARMSTARCGSRTPTARRSCDSIPRPDNGRISGRSAIRPGSASASTASPPTATTISTCSTSSPRISAGSTPRPANSRSIDGAIDNSVRAAGQWTSRTGCGSPNMAATPSACSIPRPRRSRNGCCRRLGPAL